MKVGDLVKIREKYVTSSRDPRCPGTVLKFDVYGNTERIDAKRMPNEPIVEVLWARGDIRWIMQKKLEVVSESR